MPTINHLFPGAGVTPFTVWDLSFEWWLVYVANAKTIIKSREATNGRK